MPQTLYWTLRRPASDRCGYRSTVRPDVCTCAHRACSDCLHGPHLDLATRSPLGRCSTPMCPPPWVLPTYSTYLQYLPPTYLPIYMWTVCRYIPSSYPSITHVTPLTELCSRRPPGPRAQCKVHKCRAEQF